MREARQSARVKGLAGFLALAGLLLLPGRPEAQSPPGLEIETFPQSPLAGEYWAVRFLVDHPLPREVEVELPPLPPALSLDRIRVEPRLTEEPGGLVRRRTMLEYYFFLRAAGQVSLRPFELSIPRPELPGIPDIPEGQRLRFFSPALQFTVRAPGEGVSGRASPARNPRLSWKEPPALLHPGEEAELALVLQSGDLPLLSPQALLPRTPVGTILEAAPLREGDEAAGVLLRLRIIPLEEGRLNIPAFSVPAGDYSLDIPALSVPVSPVGTQPASGAPSPEEAPLPPSPPARENPAFPETLPKPLFPFRAGCGSIRERAEALWNRGLRVEALAELRRNERDYAGGPALVPLRREAERLLGLSGNGDETWRPRFLRAILVIAAVSALLLGFGPSLKKVTPGLAWCYKVIGNSILRKGRKGGTSAFPPELRKAEFGVLEQPGGKRPRRLFRVFALFLAFLALFSLWRLGVFPGPARPALTRETGAFRVPGPEGSLVFRFEEGRRVLVRSLREGWAYAEIPGREEGGSWIRIEALVFY